MLETQTVHPSQARPEFHPQPHPNADALVNFVKSGSLADGGIQASQLLSEALAIDPHHHEARILLERVHQMFVPRWHFPMLADQVRNRAYAKAIAEKVKPGDVVLDIGCGAGLTAMLAARAGAKHVYTCEHQPLIAQAAVRVIAQNGLSDRITVLPKWSHNIVVGVDMPERADVVISEIVDTVLLGEGALATLKHAMSALAKPTAKAIPERGTLMAQPVESVKLANLWQPLDAEGFDMSAFHHFASVAQITANEFEACKIRPLGLPTDLFEFDFTNPSIAPARTKQELFCRNTGTLHAVLVSFRMELSPGIHLTNGVDAGGHWGRTAFLLDVPQLAKTGDRLAVVAQHDASTLSVPAGKMTHREDASGDGGWMNINSRFRAGDKVLTTVGLPH